MKEIAISAAGAESASIFHALTQEAFAETRGFAAPSTALAETVELVASQLAQGGGLLARDVAGCPVGGVRWRIESCEDGEALYFYRLSVRPEVQGCGIGGRLLAALEAVARDRGCVRVTCMTRAEVARNVGIYLRRGFEEVDRSDRCRDGTSVPTLHLEKPLPEAFLGSDSWIESGHPEIVAVARRLGTPRRAYAFVRDELAHSLDAGESSIPASASAVLAAGHGLCFAKSHLLAALLRALQVPAGLCYQRLSLTDAPDAGHTLHGLVAAFLDGRWVRLDARGNRPGIAAAFPEPGEPERLAFAVRAERGERDLRRLWRRPPHAVTQALAFEGTLAQLAQYHLPDSL